jgi:putative DNA primase/helicase
VIRGKHDKVPYTASTGRRASTTDPTTWTSFNDALAHLDTFEGVGLVLGRELIGVDLDKCRDPETGYIEPWAQKIIARLDSYTEISPSGTGLKVLLRGTLPPGR